MRRVHSLYNQFAGKNIHRLSALSDAIFGVAMTLLVLDLRVPQAYAVLNEQEFLSALQTLFPRLVIYFMSFLTLGIYWIGNQTLMSQIRHSNRHYTWIVLAFLAIVTLLPFSTSLLATFIDFRTALLVYWLNISLLGTAALAAWLYARKAGLAKQETEKAFHRAFCLRVGIAEVWYTTALALCFVFGTHIGIGLIVLIQLNYAFAPKLLFHQKPDF